MKKNVLELVPRTIRPFPKIIPEIGLYFWMVIVILETRMIILVREADPWHNYSGHLAEVCSPELVFCY